MFKSKKLNYSFIDKHQEADTSSRITNSILLPVVAETQKRVQTTRNPFVEKEPCGKRNTSGNRKFATGQELPE